MLTHISSADERVATTMGGHLHHLAVSPSSCSHAHLAELLMHGISREVHIQHDAGDSTAQPSVTKMRTPAHAAP